MLSVTHDGGKIWTTPVKVNNAPNTTTFPWVTAGDEAIDPTGCLVTSYADNSVKGGSAATVSYVRQTAGPGLLAGKTCTA